MTHLNLDWRTGEEKGRRYYQGSSGHIVAYKKPIDDGISTLFPAQSEIYFLQLRKAGFSKDFYSVENTLLKLIYRACQKVLEKWNNQYITE